MADIRPDVLEHIFDTPIDDRDERRKRKILQILSSANAGTLRMSVDRIQKLVHRAEAACLEDVHRLGTDPVKRETIKALYNVCFTDIHGASFKKIPELERQVKSLSWLFRIVNMGVARPVVVANYLGISKKNAKILINAVKEINSSPIIGTPFSGMGLDGYLEMLDYLGISHAWEDYNKKQEAMQAVVEKVKEELPGLYEKVIPHIQQVCKESGLTLELPEPPLKTAQYHSDQYETFMKSLVDKIERLEKLILERYQQNAFISPANNESDTETPSPSPETPDQRKTTHKKNLHKT